MLRDKPTHSPDETRIRTMQSLEPFRSVFGLSRCPHIQNILKAAIYPLRHRQHVRTGQKDITDGSACRPSILACEESSACLFPPQQTC